MKLLPYNKADQKAPFNVPEGYFAQLNDRIRERILIEDQTVDSTLLNDLTQTPFTAPDGYFAHLHKGIQAKVTTEVSTVNKNKTPILRKLIHNSFLQGAVAACIILCFGFWAFLKYRDTNITHTNEISKVEYPDVDADMFDEDLLIETYLSSVSEEKNDQKDKISDDYLIENIDENLLLNEI